MTILGVDVSHHQGVINWAQVKASGRDFCVIKATEGVGYVDPTLAANRQAAHAAGLVVGFYHFARLGAPAAEAAYFTKTVGPLQPGEFVVLDYEPNPVPPGSAVWSKQWLDATRNLLGVAPLIYMNTFTMNFDDWSAVARDYGLWLAKYDNSTTASPTKWWPTEAMKQHFDKGVVPGIAGPCDVDVFFGTREQLLAYGKGGTPPTPPAPPIAQEDDVRLIRTPDTTIWKLTETSMEPEGSLATANDLAKAYGVPIVSMEFAEKDPVFLDAYARRNRLIADVAAALGKAQAPVIDEAKLAAALLADPTAVQALGKAIADNLQLTPRANG